MSAPPAGGAPQQGFPPDFTPADPSTLKRTAARAALRSQQQLPASGGAAACPRHRPADPQQAPPWRQPHLPQRQPGLALPHRHRCCAPPGLLSAPVPPTRWLLLRPRFRRARRRAPQSGRGRPPSLAWQSCGARRCTSCRPPAACRCRCSGPAAGRMVGRRPGHAPSRAGSRGSVCHPSDVSRVGGRAPPLRQSRDIRP